MGFCTERGEKFDFGVSRAGSAEVRWSISEKLRILSKPVLVQLASSRADDTLDLDYSATRFQEDGPGQSEVL